jgi:hypothetical protein
MQVLWGRSDTEIMKKLRILCGTGIVSKEDMLKARKIIEGN